MTMPSARVHNKKELCVACGEYPVHHASEWLSAVLDSTLNPALAPLDHLINKCTAFLGRFQPDALALPLFRVLAFLRLGKIRTDVDENDIIRTKLLWKAAKARGITLYQFQILGRSRGMGLFVAYHEGKVRAFEGLPRPAPNLSGSLSWMDNKATLKKKFRGKDIPFAQGRACTTYRQALKTFYAVGAPVITKPNLGSRSRHSTIHITTPEQLKKGFMLARQLSPWVVAEQELQGSVFRILLINGKVAAILRRDPAHVIGDGAYSIRALAEKENQDPRRRGPSFHPLPLDDAATKELSRQGYHWDDVPPAGTYVTLGTYASRFFGGTTTDVTGHAHPDNIALFEHIAKTLDDSLVGVDFIIGGMERSWREQKLCGVIECNSLPNVELHNDVYRGNSLDVMGVLLDLAFPDAKRPSANDAGNA